MSNTSVPSGDGARGYRALVVDEEAAPAEVATTSYLKREHFTTRIVDNGPGAVAITRDFDPDVVILDLGLPGMNGLEVCRRLRTFSDAYMVVLTARETEMDTIVGLTVGADAYVAKLFSPCELVACIRAMLRRPRVAPEPERSDSGPAPLSFGPLRIDAAGCEVSLHGEPILLTRKEFDILAALSARPDVVIAAAS